MTNTFIYPIKIFGRKDNKIREFVRKSKTKEKNETESLIIGNYLLHSLLTVSANLLLILKHFLFISDTEVISQSGNIKNFNWLVFLVPVLFICPTYI